jgi:hypothetical protein
MLPYTTLFTNQEGSDPDPFRYVAVIRAPYFDDHSQSFEEGFLCRGCAGQGWAFQGPDFLGSFGRSESSFPAWDFHGKDIQEMVCGSTSSCMDRSIYWIRNVIIRMMEELGLLMRSYLNAIVVTVKKLEN